MSTTADRAERGGRPPRPWSDAPRVPGAIPWAGPGLSLLRDPTRFFARQSTRLDGTYWFESFGYRVFCTGYFTDIYAKFIQFLLEFIGQ